MRWPCVAAAPPRSLPPALSAQLLAQRFQRDSGHAWRHELVRRRDALAAAEAAMQVRSEAWLTDGSPCALHSSKRRNEPLESMFYQRRASQALGHNMGSM
jgi:hypothetical protein